LNAKIACLENVVVAKAPNKRRVEKSLQNNLHRAEDQQHAANVKRSKTEAAVFLVVDGPEWIQFTLQTLRSAVAAAAEAWGRRFHRDDADES
jgi:hypothetical protein